MIIQLSCLVFDYGGVISKFQDAHQVGEMAGILGLPFDVFSMTYFRFRDLYDAGTVDYRGFWGKIADTHGISLNPEAVERLRELDIRSWSVIDQDMVSLITELRRLVSTMAVISNITSDLLTAVRSIAPWLSLFDELVFSCEVGAVKPDPKIFNHCLERLHLPADQCLFIDDTQANVEAAMTVGMRGHRYRDLEGLKHEMRRRYVLEN